MNINKQKVIAAIAPIIALLAGYFGYQPIQELKQPSVDVNVNVPEHIKEEHQHKNWQPMINESIRKHIQEYH